MRFAIGMAFSGRSRVSWLKIRASLLGVGMESDKMTKTRRLGNGVVTGTATAGGGVGKGVAGDSGRRKGFCRAGGTFVELEEDRIAVGEWLTAQLLEQRLAAGEPAADHCICPDCQGRMRRQAEDEVRLLQTDRGEVGFLEPTYYCDRCRWSFFPSVG